MQQTIAAWEAALAQQNNTYLQLALMTVLLYTAYRLGFSALKAAYRITALIVGVVVFLLVLAYSLGVVWMQ